MLVLGTFLGFNMAARDMLVVIYCRVFLIFCNRILSKFLGLRDMGIEFDSATQNHFDGVFCKKSCTQYIHE
jgi:hypothetical protein